MTATDRERLEAKLIEHLETAQAITDELGLDQTDYLVERALDAARAVHWPHIDPNAHLAARPVDSNVGNIGSLRYETPGKSAARKDEQY